MDWRDVRKLDRLAELKAQIKPLEEEAKEIQEYLVKTFGIELPKTHETQDGKLNLTIRHNFKQEGTNPVIIKCIGQKRFNEEASMSMTKIKEAGGKQLVDKLLESGTLKAESPTIFYSFKASKQ